MTSSENDAFHVFRCFIVIGKVCGSFCLVSRVIMLSVLSAIAVSVSDFISGVFTVDNLFNFYELQSILL